MLDYVEAHPILVFLAGVFVLALVLSGLAARLIVRMRDTQNLTALDVTTGIMETFSRQAVRYAEEQARKIADNVKMPADEKLYLAVEFVKQQAGLAGIDVGADERIQALVEGSLAAERKFLEDYDSDIQFDPAALEAILDGERDLAAGRVALLGEVEDGTGREADTRDGPAAG